MRRRLSMLVRLAWLATLAGGVGAEIASAHPGSAHEASPGAIGGHGLFSGLAGLQQADAAAAMTRVAEPAAPLPAPAGPCTEEAAGSMPAGEGHNHSDIGQHGFACRMEQVAFASLTAQLKDRPNVILGEMDVKADIAAVAITYPAGRRAVLRRLRPGQAEVPLALQRDRVRPVGRGHQLRRVRRSVQRRQDGLPVDPEAHAAADAAAGRQRAQPVRPGRRRHRHRQPAQAGAHPVLPRPRARRRAYGALAHDPRRAVERGPGRGRPASTSSPTRTASGSTSRR